MIGIFISKGKPAKDQIDALNKATREWEEKAARGECEWICSWCCTGFPNGMPDKCPHSANGCDELLKRDKMAVGNWHEQL